MLKRDKMVVEHLDVQIEQTRISYSGSFSNIQPCLGILRDIMAYWAGLTIVEGRMGTWGGAPHSMVFFETPSSFPIKAYVHAMGCFLLKSKVPFQKMIPRKKIPQNWKLINTCFTHKTTLEKDDRNSTKTVFFHLEHSNFCKKSETLC